jgi:hypothetical protein
MMATTAQTTGAEMRELTIRSIVRGGAITLIFTAANVYLLFRELDHPREQYRPDRRFGGGDARGNHLGPAGPRHGRRLAGLSLLDDGRSYCRGRRPRSHVLRSRSGAPWSSTLRFPIPKASRRPKS